MSRYSLKLHSMAISNNQVRYIGIGEPPTMTKPMKIYICRIFVLVIIALHPIRGISQIVLADLDTTDQAIVIGQPMVVTLELTVSSPKVVDLGPNRVGNIVFEVTNPSGIVTEQRIPLPDFTFAGNVTLDPGKPYRQRINLASVVREPEPGFYFIGLNIVDVSQPNASIVTVRPVSIQVKPHDVQQLSEACHKLRRQIENGTTAADRLELTSELAEIQDPVAVADMRALLGRHMASDDVLIHALWKIGNPDAIDALHDSLLSSDPVAVQASRGALTDIASHSLDVTIRSRANDALQSSIPKEK
jgi:hypothetical protein